MDSLIKIGDKLLKNRFFRIIISTIGLQVLLGAFFFFIDYIGGIEGNNFFIASYIDFFSRQVFGQEFMASPIQNVIFQILELCLIYLSVYYFKGYAFKRLFKASYLAETKEWLFGFLPYKIKIPEESLKVNLCLGFLLDITLFLSLFYFWVYKGQLSRNVLVVLILVICFLILWFVIFIFEMRSLGQYILIQFIFFEPEKMGKVLDVFDRWYQTQDVFLGYKEVDEYVKFFIDLNIFRPIEGGMTMKDISDYGEISIIITDDVLALFEKEYQNYLERHIDEQA
ncbi:hypothetical protein AB3331_09475 [Streptococcus sp. H49]|uniref:hypothetical protein n=1 Tax=Streptococcus huangxiaojuni TaxID=3237239 RepID=UPI0034A51B6A